MKIEVGLESTHGLRRLATVGQLHTHVADVHRLVLQIDRLEEEEVDDLDVEEIRSRILEIAQEVFYGLTGLHPEIRDDDDSDEPGETETFYISKEPSKNSDAPQLYLCHNHGIKMSGPHHWSTNQLDDMLLKFAEPQQAKAYAEKHKLDKKTPGYERAKVWGKNADNEYYPVSSK